MATLQKLRNKGALLVAFVGVALFAFIAGDIFRPTQEMPKEATVGVINGEEITISNFYDVRNACESYYSLLYSKNNLNEGDQEEITQLAWETLVNYKTLTAKAKEAGLSLTKDELTQYVSNINWDYVNSSRPTMPAVYLRDGVFYPELLGSIMQELNNYAQIDLSYLTYEQRSSLENYVKSLQKMLNAWPFIEKIATCQAISSKFTNLYQMGAETTNQAVAERNFELDNNTYTIEVAAYPYDKMSDELAVVSDDEISKFYNTNKKLFKINSNIYDVIYINKEVKPAKKDLEALDAEFKRHAASLQEDNADIKEIEFYSSTDVPYDGYLWTADAIDIDRENGRYVSKFSTEHSSEIARLNEGEITEPYAYNMNNTYNLVKSVRRTTVPDSIKFRYIVVQNESADVVNTTIDSLLNALNNKVEFDTIAKDYSASTIEFKTSRFADYEENFMPTPELQNQMYTAKVGEYTVFDINPATKLIVEVMEKKGSVEAFDVFILQRNIPVSQEVINEEYTKLTQVLAANPTVEELEKNADCLSAQLTNDNRNIANIPGTRELLRWVLKGNNTGKTSSILEYSNNNKKYLMVVAVKDVTPKGYIGLDVVKENIKLNLKNEKKAELIAAELNGKSLEEVKNNVNVTYIPSIENVNYKKETFVKEITANEQVISTAVAGLNEGDTSAPLKGDRGVYVIKVLSKVAKNGEYNADAEKEYIQSLDTFGNPARMAGQLIQNVIENNINADNWIYEHM